MPATLHRHDLGLTWVMDDTMERGCHALRADDGRVWLVDPARDDAALAAAAELGEPAGVLHLLDRHDRDGAAIASDLGVRRWTTAEILEEAGRGGGGALPFEVRRVVVNPLWKEAALWWPARRALVVAESLGTNAAFALGDAVGVHPLRRLLPPGMLKRLDAQHLLVGHGAPLHGPGTGAAVDRAIGRARIDIPRLLVKLPGLVRGARS